MELTVHQSEKLEECLDILLTSKRLLISGSAGVGKTFMVNELVKRLSLLLPKNKKIYCSAPTNKAVSVLKGKVDEGSNIEFLTVHSGLKIKKDVNYKTGKVTFKPFYNEKYPPLKNVALFIIDETSMLNTELLNYVEVHAKKNNSTVIFIGDHKQLNPVGEEISPVFLGEPNIFIDKEKAEEFKDNQSSEATLTKTPGKAGYTVYVKYPEVELTQIIRQGEGNPIINLSRNLELIGEKEAERKGDTGYIFSDNQAQVVETLAAVNGTDELKYLAWTNKEVDLINSKVRKRIYGESPAKIELGETLIFNEPFKEEYFASKEVKVETLEVKEKKFFYPSGKSKNFLENVVNYKAIKFKYYSINKKFSVDSQEYEDDIIIIHEDSEEDFKKLLKNLSVMCSARVIDWVDMFKFKESFADTKYNHAITIHKSQGSSYKQTIVNISNIKLNRNMEEKKRLLYTAITRTSKLLILYKV